MEIKPIEERAHIYMTKRFEAFVREITELCGNQRIGNDWLDNQQVCELLNISKRTLQYYRDSAKIPFSMVGKKCYYKAADVEQLLGNSRIK